MAKLSVVVRNRKREKLVAKFAAKRKELKAAGNWEALDKLPRNSSAVRVRRRCAITGRPRGTMRQFGICRIVFRDMAHDGKIPGVRKASW